ncbi:MAG: TIGR00645 family protein [Rhodobacter sp.]|nr:TIGR00645 family protein [Rhodobacter sp.]MCA3514195.1 TIGR00645 family protein [Rhodobacter sp.]MCA3520267.1 TIGR00645 family protein [Rhodobacter sp.]MCA3523666.1 TIGR00645 family protein [Rhodobacter sp.]MCA3526858.1 TIGR00645 family protein [Rhodobacter sp.]
MLPKNQVEQKFEQVLFLSRWLMAPMYMGLVVTLGMLMVVFLRDLWKYALQIMTMSAEQVILVALTLIDLTLAANLLLIVLFSGYENFVSKLEIDDGGDRPDWMGTVDFSGLKMKLIASIVAISGIHLLKRFMEIGDSVADAKFGETELYWFVVIHLTFVVSGVMLAAMDWLSVRSAKK